MPAAGAKDLALSVKARLLMPNADIVGLPRKVDGQVVEAPLAKFSPASQDFADKAKIP